MISKRWFSTVLVLSLILLLPDRETHAQTKPPTPVEQRANDVLKLMKPDAGEYEKYFSKAFLTQVSPEKLTAVFNYYSTTLGRCLKVEAVSLAGPLTGTFTFTFEKNATVPANIALDATEPHLIASFWLGNPVSQEAPAVAGEKKEFKERELKFAGAGGLTLYGTFLLPLNAASKVPGVLLLPGSGATDRNGNQPPLLVTDLLKQIAERLAKEGYASLRFDKRSAVRYAKSWPTEVTKQNDFFSWDSFVGDAKAGLANLQAQPEVDGQRVVVAGHSEGGTIAVQIAHDLQGTKAAPAGLILLSTPGRTGSAILREQIAASLKRNSVPAEQARLCTYYVDLAIDQLQKTGTIPPNAPAGLGLEYLFPASAAKLLQVELAFEPASLLSAYTGPVLVVQGEKDIQISAARDTPLLSTALKQRQQGASEVLFVKSASHNLKTVGDENADPGLAGPVAPGVLDTIVLWLRKDLH
jgi:pimeloyl-ACP methyl ester carboxylesterase